jgi:hypothetical protein
MGEVEVPAGKHHCGANPGDHEQAALPGGLYGLSICGKQSQDEPRCLYEDGSARDDVSDLSVSHEQSPAGLQGYLDLAEKHYEVVRGGELARNAGRSPQGTKF